MSVPLQYAKKLKLVFSRGQCTEEEFVEFESLTDIPYCQADYYEWLRMDPEAYANRESEGISDDDFCPYNY